MDLISRQEAINEIMGKPAWHCSEGSYYHSSDIKDALEKLPSAQQWIPCSERLPEDGTYLCWERQGFCYVDSFKNGDWNLHDDDQVIAECIAWMPLPEPYRADMKREQEGGGGDEND